MEFVKCPVCGKVIVAGAGEELGRARARHAELDEAAVASLRALFPGWVDSDGACEACADHLRQLVAGPAARY